jgi:DNA replication protein DnaC
MNEKAIEERVVTTLECPKHGKYTGELVTLNLKPFGKSMMKIHTMCPVCEKEIDAEQLKKHEHDFEAHRITALKAMNIDELFWDSTFDNFEAYNDELRKHFETCRKFAKKPKGKLVMLGENGNGKTHLAICILKELGGVIYTATEIGIALRQRYGSGGSREHEVFEQLCTAPLLVIDEVEKIKDSEWKNYWMSHIVGKRYNRMLPIIFIANCHTKKNCKEPVKPCPKCLEYHLENDVLSRIIEDGIVMNFDSPDYREKKRLIKMGRE